MVTIFLVKHDDTAQDGLRQIRTFFQGIPLHKVYASSHPKDYDTAKKASNSHELDIVRNDNLNGRYFENHPPSKEDLYTRPPKVESMLSHQARILNEFYQVASNHQDKTVLLVCDDEANTSILCHLLDVPLLDSRSIQQDPACIHRLEIDPLGQLRGCDINYTGHLK